jgi:hypothetical protein
VGPQDGVVHPLQLLIRLILALANDGSLGIVLACCLLKPIMQTSLLEEELVQTRVPGFQLQTVTVLSQLIPPSRHSSLWMLCTGEEMQ